MIRTCPLSSCLSDQIHVGYVCVHARVCVCVCMRVCMRVCVCARARVYACDSYFCASRLPNLNRVLGHLPRTPDSSQSS